MASSFDCEDLFVVDFRFGIAAQECCLGERMENVESCDDGGVFLDAFDVLQDLGFDFEEKFVFELGDFFFCGEDFFFIFFELWCYEAFGVYESLFANVVVWD